MKCKDCRKCEECKDDGVKWCKKYRKGVKVLDYCITYEDCDCYLEYKKVIKILYFMSERLKCGQKSLFIADYFIQKVLTMFEYWNKNVEKFILSLRKGVLYCVTNTLFMG